MSVATKPPLQTYLLVPLLFSIIFGFSNRALAQKVTGRRKATVVAAKSDSLKVSKKDTVIAKMGKAPAFRPKDRFTNRFVNRRLQSPLLLKDPKNVKDDFRVNPATNQISITEKVTNKSPLSLDYRPPQIMTFEEYTKLQNTYVRQNIMRDYENMADGKSAITGRGLKPLLEKSPLFDRIFGGNVISAKPNGFVTLDFLYKHQFVNSPTTPQLYRNTNNFDFQQHINTNLTTKIGEKVGFAFNYDTKAAFNFDNKIKLNFKNQPEDILQAVEVGNIAFPLQTQLIPGVQNLLGVKTKLRFGKLDVALVASQQHSSTQSIRLNGGSQSRNFEIRCDNYDENRHFFLSQFFRNNYERALKNLPLVLSDVRITRMEVYVTNRSGDVLTPRNIAAFMDLGDGNPANKSITGGKGSSAAVTNKGNNLYNNLVNNNAFRLDTSASVLQNLHLTNGIDYEVLHGAKRLSDREFKFNPLLGYISMVTPLRNDEVLAVAYEYIYQGQTYKVGELAEDYASRKENEVIMLKLLKSSVIRNHLDSPMWNLMMKNVYSLNTTQLNQTGFQLRVIYKDDKTGIDSPYLQDIRNLKSTPLLQVFNLDKLNSQNDPQPDGNFDFVEDATIDSKLGKIFFPVLEPFGSSLSTTLTKYIDSDELPLKDKYVYNELYSTTLTDAQQITTKNKFFMKGSVQSSNAAEVQLPLGVAGVSVKVFAAGVQLKEGSDYTVDTQLGRVKITNQSVINSAQEIRIDYEKPDLFNTQTRTMLGTRLDYNLSREVHLGATAMYLKETPAGYLTRVAVGNEPVKNMMLGTDVQIKKDSRWLTRLLDKIPNVQTKETSAIQFTGEYAQLIPGVNTSRTNGNSMVDDFEAARNINDLAHQPTKWRLGSTPDQFNPTATKGFAYNDKRAKISAYTVDPSVYIAGSATTPTTLTNADFQNVYERPFYKQDIFTGASIPVAGLVSTFSILDVSYFPTERGMYNYNTNLNADGRLASAARQNFGAIMRGITSDNDFDNSNVQYLEFWLLDPFVKGPNGQIKNGTESTNNISGGKLLIHLGDVSEDVMPNGKNDFENGLPAGSITTPAESTTWGNSPGGQFTIDAFDNNNGSLQKQDVGLDGLSDADEKKFPAINNYLKQIQGKVKGSALTSIQADPSGDDFQSFFSTKSDSLDLKIVARYKNFMGMEGNSSQNDATTGSTVASTNLPDKEDINADNTINNIESYYEYQVDLRDGKLAVGNGYIVDKVITPGTDISWYLFRIPIRQNDGSPNFRKVGDINGFKSIRFMRMVLTDFQEPVVLRFATLQLVADQYRTYTGKLSTSAFAEVGEPNDDTGFKVGAVNIEENGCPPTGPCNKGNKTPYVVPPGFVRDRDFTQQSLAQFNEQSLSLTVTNLHDGDARAVFKNTKLDLINYKRLQMFIHMESTTPSTDNDVDGAVGAFIRLGTDLTDNYYEVEIPKLSVTPPTPNASADAAWPKANYIDIPIAELIDAKRKYEISPTDSIAVYPYLDEFGTQIFDKNNNALSFKVHLRGRPDLTSVQTIMLGVRNPKDDGKPKSCILWLDELRTNGIQQTASGRAATASASIKLADIGTVTLQGSIRTFGFGTIQDHISDRARETTTAYGIQTNLQLDKFLPEKWGLKIPFFINYNKQTVAPHYDPLDPDMELKMKYAIIDSLYKLHGNTGLRSTDYQNLVVDRSIRQGFNFSNVRKIRMNKDRKQHFYDIENFSFTYAQNSILKSNILLDEYAVQQKRGGIAYQYAFKPFNWEPFKNTKSLDRPFLYFIKDINFNPLPTLMAFRTDFNRSYTKTQMRVADGEGGVTTSGIQPTYEKYFLMNRIYDVQWNFTKSFMFSYAAQMNAIIDEPYGDAKAGKDSLWKSLLKFGRPKNFDQRFTTTYRLPTDKFFLFDWIQADAKYNTSFKFTASSFGLKDDAGLAFGNTISNSRERGVVGKVDFVKLYNKLKYLKFANMPSTERKRQTRNPGDDENFEAQPSELKKTFTRLLMTIRGINFDYNILETTILPGFLPNPGRMGLNVGPDFALLGSQNDNILERAAGNNWLSKSTEQNQPFTQAQTRRFNIALNLEPVKDFRMQIKGTLNRGDGFQANFRADSLGNFPTKSGVSNAVRTGNFSMSFWSFMTADFLPFHQDAGANNSSALFDKMREYRQTILNRLNASPKIGNIDNVVSSGSYNLNSQDVLIPAFFAAYSGKSPDKVKMNPFLSFPMPNWRLDYSGLANLPAFNRIFSSLTIAHSYSSTYSVGNFTSSLDYGAAYVNLAVRGYPLGFKTNDQLQYIPIFVMSTITMNEKFAPLIGIQFTLKDRSSKASSTTTLGDKPIDKNATMPTRSSISGRIEYNQDRNIALNLDNPRIAELSNKDLVMMMGYKKNNVKLPFRNGDGKTLILKNDLNLQFQLTIRDTKNFVRQIDGPTSPVPQVSDQGNITAISGSAYTFQAKPSIQYEINKKISLTFYIEWRNSNPYVSNSPKTSYTTGDLQLKFNLAEL